MRNEPRAPRGGASVLDGVRAVLRTAVAVFLIPLLPGAPLHAGFDDPSDLFPDEPAARAKEDAGGPKRLSLGINYTGVQLGYDFDPSWRGELRYLTGKENAAAGKVSAQVAGVRTYRFLGGERRMRPYLGAEGAYLSAHQEGTAYTASGLALGGFVGFECRVARRVSIGADIGPYVLRLKERTTHVTSSSLDFVGNTYAILRLF